MVKVMNKHNLSISNFNKKIILGIKLLLFGCILLGFFYYVSNQYTEDYCAALIDKVERIKSIEEPKIVILGNSNIAFGIDSEMIQEELGMPVVNMGLHGNLGNMFHEEMARINVKEGDIYVLCHTSYNDPSEIVDPVLGWVTIENHIELYQILRTEDIWPMLKAYPIYLKRCLNRYSENYTEPPWENIYSRKKFNSYGDVGEIRTENLCNFEELDLQVAKIDKENIDRINSLASWLEKKGATLVIAGYPIADGQGAPEKEEYVQFQAELEEAVECEVISEFTDYMYDYKYFFDTRFHLTTEGAKLRTKQLIEDLKAWKEF